MKKHIGLEQQYTAHIAPPLIITRAQIDEAISGIQRVLNAT